MNKSVEKDRTLLVSGPSSVKLLKGKVSVLGAKLSVKDKVIVRKGKALPFEAEACSVLDIVNGIGTKVEEVDGSTVPVSWRKAVKELLSLSIPRTVMVLGDVDCGKTTFCTFMINNALSSASKTPIIDADLGQSDLGPPATIGLGLVEKPVTDLFFVKATATYFVGNTSPSGVTDRVISGLTKLKEKALGMGSGLIVINTDGWVQGDGAKEYKVRMIKTILPEAVVCIQYGGELEDILTSVEGNRIKILRLNPSPSISRRSREERKMLREQGYRKLLEDTALRNLPISWVKLENTFLSLENAGSERKLKLDEILGRKVLCCRENSNNVFAVLKGEKTVDYEKIKTAEKAFQKKLQIINESDARWLLVGLLNDDRDFLGLGVIQGIDYEKKVLRLYTSYRGKVDIVQFGQVKVDRYGKELGIATGFLHDQS
ncbi:MAG: Clp1/GlmU family protein [Candidatus Bathyarchaeota archaeon]|nr:Clp1/GlmU family protein [Candidatus Bathyarchaeota archaeon]